jgi:signal transduction histidine kinase
LSAIVIFLFFRYQTVNTIHDTNEVSYSALAFVIADSLHHHLHDYLQQAASQDQYSSEINAIDSELNTVVHRLITHTPIVRVKLYDQTGKVIFSTKQSQIGNLQNDNPGFRSAIKGEAATKFIYRDTLNVFDQETEDANLLHCYIPISQAEGSAPLGVLEVYADVNQLVLDTSKIELWVLLFTVLVMSGLYLVLIFYVKRAKRIINQQQQLAFDKQKLLEALSAKMIHAQENEKKRISDELHENVIQTITAVKLYFEQCIVLAANKDSKQSLTVPYPIIPILQDAIKQIRAVSIDLRPPSLDNFGLQAATNTLISEFNNILSDMKIRVAIDLPEGVLTDDKKSIIYRILKDTLRMISLHKNLKGEILIWLRINQGSNSLQLSIEVMEDNNVLQADDLKAFELMRENTLLSGGEFQVTKDAMGILRAVSEWENI